VAAPARILIVDDEPFNRDVLAQELELLDHEALSAVHGRDALERLGSEPVDLILLDIMMPEMDGLAVVRKIRAEPALSQTPVVVISALAAAEDRRAALEAGADAFLAKPFTMEELTQAIGPFVNVEMAQDTVEPTASPGE
jgi:CheY-like chemotaxis protein